MKGVTRNAARRSMDRIVRLRQSGRDEDAVATARRYATMRPQDPSAWTIWADLLLQLHRPQEAEEVLREGIQHVSTS
jgi:Flp pilus assembly protein TadD